MHEALGVPVPSPGLEGSTARASVDGGHARHVRLRSLTLSVGAQGAARDRLPLRKPIAGHARATLRDREAVRTTMTTNLQRRLATVFLVGMLTFGEPMRRPITLTMPPAVVRVQVSSAGAEAWRAAFPNRPLPN